MSARVMSLSWRSVMEALATAGSFHSSDRDLKRRKYGGGNYVESVNILFVPRCASC